MNYMPMVLETDGRGERNYDLVSRLLKDRIIYISGVVEQTKMDIACMQVLYLDSVDSNKDISLYINSPGGSVHAGLALADTLAHVKAPIRTIATGMAMSMGAYLLSCGTKGKRMATPGCRIMCHQVSSGSQGTAADMKVSMKETEYLDDYLAETLARNCGQPLEKYRQDTQRDFYMSAQQALEYGLIDEIVKSKK